MASLLLASCGHVGYYAQSVHGHLSLMSKADSIETLLASEALGVDLRRRLERSQQLRDYASSRLYLPENQSYRYYSDVGRPYVVWNVVAADEFSVIPHQWCFWVVGCLSYRGYFDKAEAERYAQELTGQGLDVAVSGSQAYSTLGWFSDPLLNTLVQQPEVRLAELMFHELAHQQLYIDNDTAFNEAFATAVSRWGVAQWLKQEGNGAAFAQYRTDLSRRNGLNALLLATRDSLAELYARPIEVGLMRQEKERLFARMQQAYRELKLHWGGYSGYDHWMASGLNNANLSLVATYHHYVPAFLRLLERLDGDLRAFYTEAERLGQLPREERHARLAALSAESVESMMSPPAVKSSAAELMQ